MRSPLVFVSRGQMALDLLLAMIILLVALSSFTPILARFQDTQAQVSLTQQLRSNASLSAMFISDSVNFFRPLVDYPATNTLSVGADLPHLWNNHAYFVGSVAPSVIRALHTAQGFDCISTLAWVSGASSFSLAIPRAQAGTDEDVVGSSPIVYNPDYPSSMIHFQGCFAPLTIRSGA